jgi:AraC-like DNA-binding protein
MSRSRFAQRFREVVGATPGDHIAMCRIAKAQQLLRQGCELKAVAEKVGFASASAFTRAFTRAMGVAPGRWRSSAAAQA